MGSLRREREYCRASIESNMTRRKKVRGITISMMDGKIKRGKRGTQRKETRIHMRNNKDAWPVMKMKGD